MICQPVRGHKHHTGGCLKMVSMRVFRLMAALFCLVFPAAGPAPCHEWIQPEPGQPPRWGHPDGLEAGGCRYRLKGGDWQSVTAGQSFNVPANSSFDIEVTGEPYHYICHFG